MKSGRFSQSRFTPQSPWLDLVNSEQWNGFGLFTDHLLESGWVVKFLRYWKSAPARKGLLAYKELAGLRHDLRRMAEQISAGLALGTPEVRVLNTALELPAYRRISYRQPHFDIELVPVRWNWAWIRAQIVLSFVEALQSNTSRIKICPNTRCRWVFFDTTRNNVRRWCNDRSCGNRDRVRRARARHEG